MEIIDKHHSSFPVDAVYQFNGHRDATRKTAPVIEVDRTGPGMVAVQLRKDKRAYFATFDAATARAIAAALLACADATD